MSDLTKFKIQHQSITSYVYELPAEPEVIEQLADGKVAGKLPGGGDFSLDLWPADAKPDSPPKLQLVITISKTEEKGDA